MAFTTKGMDTGKIDVSIHRKIGDALTEAEIIIKTAVRDKKITPGQRIELKKKLGPVPGALRVYLVDMKEELTSTQIAKLQLFQRNIQEFVANTSTENNLTNLLTKLQALQEELDDLLG